MKTLRQLVALLVLALGLGPAFALGVDGGLDQLDSVLVGARLNDTDPAHQAAIDQARAILAAPGIDTIEKQVKAYAAATAVVEKAYGNLDDFAAQVGGLMVQLDAGITLPVLLLQGRCQGVLLEYTGNLGAIVSLSKKLAKLGKSFAKSVEGQTDRAKRLKALAKAAKKYAAFYNKYHRGN